MTELEKEVASLTLPELLTDPEAKAHLAHLRATVPEWVRGHLGEEDALTAYLRAFVLKCAEKAAEDNLMAQREIARRQIPSAERPAFLMLAALQSQRETLDELVRGGPITT